MADRFAGVISSRLLAGFCADIARHDCWSNQRRVWRSHSARSDTVTNEATAATRSAVSNEAGEYTIPSLPPGVYTITAEMKGFRTEIQKGQKLDVNQTLRADLAMKVGE